MEAQAQEHPTYYTNAVTLNVGPYDVVLNLGLRLPESGETPPTPLCTVVMSPQHAKVVADILRDGITRHEAEHGEMRVRVPKPKDARTPERPAQP